MKRAVILGIAVIALGLLSFWFLRNGETDQIKYLSNAIQTGHQQSEIVLEEQIVVLEDGSRVTLRVPSEFTVSVAASNLDKARFMAWSSDGRLFVPDIVDYELSHQGRLFVLDDWNEETGQFENTHTYLSGLRGPNSVAFYTDSEGQDWLYLALTEHLVRYPYEAGDTEPSGEPEVIMEFPNEQSPGEVSVVWHITRTILFEKDRLYVSVGSGCNSCEELAGDMRAMIYSMNPDGTDQRVEGEGLRNTVGIEMAEGELYATANGVDHLGNDAPDEMMYKITNGQHYGWPYCYVQEGKNVADDSQSWNDPINCEDIPLPFTTFKSRSAPLGLRYFESGSHPALVDSFLVAIHGSFVPESGASPEIRRVTRDGENEVFIDGFSVDSERIIRPVDFLQKERDSFFFSDDHGGRIFYVKAK